MEKLSHISVSNLIICHVIIEGWRYFSLIQASAVVKRHCILAYLHLLYWKSFAYKRDPVNASMPVKATL